MQIKAEVKKIFTDGGKLKALFSLVFDDAFIVCNVRLVEGSKGLFAAMPSFKNAEGKYKDICFSINSGFREKIQSAVMAAYDEALKENE